MPLEPHPTDPDKLVMRAGNYNLQKPWVGLTAEEIHDTEGYKETREMYRFARNLEAKLKEKNT